ncbi:MAG: hypothetical protein LBH71_01820, partial [Oscillospiraceae bacterium]|nr:hypothetical protein [Oscillospiraceae bacterium]
MSKQDERELLQAKLKEMFADIDFELELNNDKQTEDGTGKENAFLISNQIEESQREEKQNEATNATQIKEELSLEDQNIIKDEQCCSTVENADVRDDSDNSQGAENSFLYDSVCELGSRVGDVFLRFFTFIVAALKIP